VTDKDGGYAGYFDLEQAVIFQGIEDDDGILYSTVTGRWVLLKPKSLDTAMNRSFIEVDEARRWLEKNYKRKEKVK